jgi:hypothetical protein
MRIICKNLFLIMFALILLPSVSLGADKSNGSAGSPLELTDMTISVSPGVFAFYRDDGQATPQWYLIATAHNGGTKYFATAQNSTSVFKQEDTASPITLGELEGLDYPDQDQAASEDYWSDGNAWTR